MASVTVCTNCCCKKSLLTRSRSADARLLKDPGKEEIAPNTGGPDARVHEDHLWRYPLHDDIVTTVFWCGELPSADNGHISNVHSAWDSRWVHHFGGEDTPDKRRGALPAAFTPKENPFYFALPYNDFDDRGKRKSSAEQVVYWAAEKTYEPRESMLKNRWIQVSYTSRTCYGQWADVGPYHQDDEAYVFGTRPPKNRAHPRAGLDLSPAMRDCLGMKDVAKTSWRFVAASEVPPGPWKQIITTRNRRP